MSNTTIQKPTAKTQAIKSIQKDVKLDLNSILNQVWVKGLPNGISNII